MIDTPECFGCTTAVVQDAVQAIHLPQTRERHAERLHEEEGEMWRTGQKEG